MQRIGPTPLAELGSFGSLNVYAKLENTEPSGSIKYRSVSRMLDDAVAAGRLREGMRVIEVTSGNTGIALALRGRELGYGVTIVADKSVTELAKRMIEGYGAKIIEVDGWFAACEKVINSVVSKDPEKWYWPKQTSNPSSLASNVSLGEEIEKQFKELYGGSIDVYIGSCSTGSTLTGVAIALKRVNPKIIVYRVLPASEYRYPGVDDEEGGTVPLPLYDKTFVDKRIRIGEHAAIDAVKRLKMEYGHDVGVSAGADFAAAMEVAKTEKGNCVIIFPDSGNRYNL